MVAVAVYTDPAVLFAQLFALGICVGLAVLVLVAHLARPAAKRLIAGVTFALALLLAHRPHQRAGAPGVVIMDICKGLTPSDWEYWAYGCFWP